MWRIVALSVIQYPPFVVGTDGKAVVVCCE